MEFPWDALSVDQVRTEGRDLAIGATIASPSVVLCRVKPIAVGTLIRKFQPVSLAVSKGPELVSVPNVVGRGETPHCRDFVVDGTTRTMTQVTPSTC